LREATVAAMARRFGVAGLNPGCGAATIGSRSWWPGCPTLLGLGPDDLVVLPELAYPSYEVGARLAGAQWLRSDSVVAVGPRPVRLVWINSPSNPTGRVLPPAHLRKVVDWARERGAVVRL